MANLPEISEFTANIYQLEITDPAEAGPDGVLNYQAKALANRTTWLKDNLTSLNAFPGELKFLALSSTGFAEFISTNFPLGVGNGIYTGWFIANGANGTQDMGGKVPVAYGNTFSTINAVGGEVNHVLTIPEMPSHSHTVYVNSGSGGSINGVEDAVSNGSLVTSSSVGGGQSHNNMQPYRVVLCIQKG